MNPEAHAEFLRIIDSEIKRFDDESKAHKNLFRRHQVYLITLSTLTSVVAGSALLLSAFSRYIEFLVLTISAINTGLASWSEMRKPRELWQHEREIYYSLLDIKREFLFRSSLSSLNEETLLDYFNRVNSILGSSSLKWHRIQEKKAGSEPGRKS